MPRVELAAPATSKRPLTGSLSWIKRRAAHSMAIPIGRLIKKPTRHDSHSASTPPSTSPTLAAIPATALYSEMARVRSRPSAKVVCSKARVDGARMAAPRPWMARAATIAAGERARPIASEATVNSDRPSISMRRRPKVSPARAASSMKPPKLRVYALCTQARPVSPKPRSWRILGRPVSTMEVSSTIIT